MAAHWPLTLSTLHLSSFGQFCLAHCDLSLQVVGMRLMEGWVDGGREDGEKEGEADVGKLSPCNFYLCSPKLIQGK